MLARLSSFPNVLIRCLLTFLAARTNNLLASTRVVLEINNWCQSSEGGCWTTARKWFFSLQPTAAFNVTGTLYCRLQQSGPIRHWHTTALLPKGARAMPNPIIHNPRLVPELLQDASTPTTSSRSSIPPATQLGEFLEIAWAINLKGQNDSAEWHMTWFLLAQGRPPFDSAQLSKPKRSPTRRSEVQPQPPILRLSWAHLKTCPQANSGRNFACWGVRAVGAWDSKKLRVQAYACFRAFRATDGSFMAAWDLQSTKLKFKDSWPANPEHVIARELPRWSQRMLLARKPLSGHHHCWETLYTRDTAIRKR